MYNGLKPVKIKHTTKYSNHQYQIIYLAYKGHREKRWLLFFITTTRQLNFLKPKQAGNTMHPKKNSINLSAVPMRSNLYGSIFNHIVTTERNRFHIVHAAVLICPAFLRQHQKKYLFLAA